MNLLSNIKRNSPLFLSIAGVAGLITTIIFTYKDAPKAKEALEKQEEESVYEPSIVEKAMVVAPICWREIVAGSATAFCILFSNYISRKQQAALFGAAMISNQMLEKFKKQLTPEQLEEVECKMAEKSYKEQNMEYITHDAGEELYHETYCDKWFYSNPRDVLAAQYHFNRNFTIGQARSILEYFDFLGIELTKEERSYWAAYGYNVDEFFDGGLMPWIDFEDRDAYLENGTKYHKIGLTWDPTFDYEHYRENYGYSLEETRELYSQE